MDTVYLVDTYINGNKTHAREEFHKLSKPEQGEVLENAYFEEKEHGVINFVKFVQFLYRRD